MVLNRVLRAAGYRRVSMREQVDGHSLDAQATHIQNYVAAQGWRLIELYTDAGLSAKKARLVLPLSACWPKRVKVASM
jgi:DNA invertase Pin-like site-specific DNA recombinase